MGIIFSLLGILLSLSGCGVGGKLWRDVDSWVFGNYGVTIFVKPEQLTLRSVHLGAGEFNSGDIVIEGRITDVSTHGTYLVLFDDIGRLLIVLTEIETNLPLTASDRSGVISVLGSIESGKKGLPLLRARAIRLRPDAKGSAGSGKEA